MAIQSLAADREDGVQYEKDAKGTPILLVFKLAASEVAHPTSEAPAFAKNSPVSKAEKVKELASASPTPGR